MPKSVASRSKIRAMQRRINKPQSRQYSDREQAKRRAGRLLSAEVQANMVCLCEGISSDMYRDLQVWW
jgi:hypothetical protein